MKRNITILSAIICLLSFNVQALPPTLEFNTLSVDPNGIVWIGTNEYLYSKLPGGELIKRYYTTGDGNAYLPIVNMAQYTATTPYKMLLASSSGARYFTFNNDQLTDGAVLLSDKPVSSVAIDANSKWIAAPGGFSVYKEGGNQMSISYKDATQKNVIENNAISSIILKNDTAYMVTQDNGVRAVERFIKGVDGVTGASPYEQWGPCLVSDVLCMAIDENGEQWFGGENGLYWHQSSDYFNEWQEYTTSDGLPVNRIQSIATTSDYAWAGTQQGVSRVKRDASNGSIQVKNYSVTDDNGIIDMAVGPDHTVYAITKKTLYAISGDEIAPIDHISVEKAISATNISIFPNPASNYINVEIDLDAPAKADISLFSLDGKKVRQFFRGSIEAKETLSFPLNGITPGSYLCTLTIGKDRFANIVVIK